MMDTSWPMDATTNGSVMTTAVPGPTPNPQLKTAYDLMITIILAVIMLAMGCTVTWDNLKVHLRRPFGILIGLLSQFVLLPLIAFGLAHALQLPPNQALGMLILSCCPGGTLSNIFTLWVDGNVPLSICMTTVSTTLAMGLMPLNLFIYSRSWTGVGAVIPYERIAIALVLILIPTFVGALIRWKLPRVAAVILKVASLLGLMLIFAAIIMQGFLYPYMFQSSWKIWFSAAIRPIIGFGLGFLVAKVTCMKTEYCRTVGMETGCQNLGLCLTLISLSFDTSVIGEMNLFPLLFGIFMMAEGFIGCGLYKLWKMRCSKSTKCEQPNGDVKIAVINEGYIENTTGNALPELLDITKL